MKDFEIRCDESRLETNHALYGKFTLGPFLPGQGTTFGNALRRSLLSELSGLAITAFEILGVMQEFSILPGLRESILDLSLNLKQVVLTGILPYSTPPIGFLKIRGPAVIKAADLKLPAGIYCTSPDQYIATLSSDGILNLKIVVSVGKGYSTQPYSFYQSLSKIKLQPTFFNASRENEEKNAFLPNKSEVMYGLRTPSKAKSTESLFHETKEKDTKTAIHLKNQTTSSLFPTNVTPLQGMKHSLGSVPNRVHRETESSQKGAVENQAKLVSLFRGTDKFFNSTNQPLVNSANPSDLVNKTNSKFIPRLRDQSSELFNTSSSTFNTLNTVNGGSGFSSEINQYGDIQSQIFQRIKPHQVLPIDAVFTPVSQVNFLIQINDRFEIPRENIVLEIWTNGSIHPKRALEEATLSLVQNFDTLLKKIQQSSSIYKGLRYWSYLQSSDYRSNETSVPRNPSFENVEKIENEVGKKVGETTPIATPIEETNSSYSFTEGIKPPTSQVNNLLPPRSTKMVENSKSEAQAVGAKSGLTSSASLSLPSQHMEGSNPPLAKLSSATPSTIFDGKDREAKVACGTEVIANSGMLKMVEDGKLVLGSSKIHLHRAIYNLDIGNLNLSLETFVLLKQANINTLAQLLTHFSSQKNTLSINSKNIENSFFLDEKIVQELKSVVTQFS